MVVSSRTPEGEPHLCSICGAIVVTDPADPLGNSVCPRCGTWLASLTGSLGSRLGSQIDRLDIHASLGRGLGVDSLDVVELVMELEEEFDVNIPDDEAEKIRTIADFIRLIRKWVDGQGLEE